MSVQQSLSTVHLAAVLVAVVFFWRSLRAGGPASRAGRRVYILAMAIVALTTVALLLASPTAQLLYARYLKAAATSPDSVLAAARATMRAAKYCFLITLDEAGQPQARMMQPFEPEADMTVWMGTNRTTRKVRQLQNNPRATLAYYDPEGIGYVAVLGHARLVEDLSERRKRYQEAWDAFYPEGPAGSTYVLIEFTPARIEVVSHSHKVAAQPLAWRPAILVREGAAWKLDGP